MSELPNLPFAVFDEFGQSCEDRVADHYRAAVQAAQPEAVGDHAPCKGTNCGITRTDQAHSPECYAEHDAACKVNPLDTPGNRHREYRYAGYKGQPLKPGCTADQSAAYREGVRASAPTPEAVGEPVAQVADVYMSRYTIEWTNGPLPEGTNLYAAPVTLVEQGKPIKPSNAWAYPKDSYAMPVLFNPYTGEPRDARDVQSDPRGVLIAPPGKALPLAAEPETVGRPCKVGGGCVPTATSDCACRELAAPTPEPMSAPTAEADERSAFELAPREKAIETLEEVADRLDGLKGGSVSESIQMLRTSIAALRSVPADGTFPPRNIIWDSLHPDYPVEWSNPGRPAREGEVHYIRYDLFSDAVHASLATPPSAATPDPSDAERCPNCDDTGDVHDQTGEWRGTCKCPAGKVEACDIEAVAKVIAERMDYPWEHMYEKGRNNMRDIAREAIDAAIRATKGGKL